MRRLAVILVIATIVAGCKTTTVTLPPVVEYRTVIVPMVRPDTTLGAFKDLRDEIVAHGPVAEIVSDSGRVRARFVRGDVAGAMLDLAWVQQMLDAFVELVNRRLDQ